MVIAKQTVIHKIFGRGMICGIDGAYISVLFKNGEKRFVFPDAFMHFLRFENSEFQSEVEAMAQALDREKREKSARAVSELTEKARENKREIAALMEAEAESTAQDDADEDEYAIFDWRALSVESVNK